MSDAKTGMVLTGLTVAFLALASGFRTELWGRVEPIAAIPLVDPIFTNTATVRRSAGDLIRAGEDTSQFECYTCHERNKVLKLDFDEHNRIILPEEHKDLRMEHGSSGRNENCYNCHDPENLETLKTRDGRRLKFEESTLLCASCHGPTYRDWEHGIHGRTTGYWDRREPVVRKDCTSCHDPHAPPFPAITPAPGPHPLHPKKEAVPHTKH